ncbi:MAG: NAD-dependent dehydratase [Deltaproteobacteria bacterium]|nr:NAD-dependent dehydratase [Deltaproteobacteria bacterium]HCH66913.1 NAD-dependent dehydratase [Deltaproteobacteria bacterium]
MRILVTGGAGFVGTNLCKRLLADGHSVVALDNLCTGSTRNLAMHHGRQAFEFIQADLCQGVPASGRFDRIYHMASPASPIHYVRLPFATLDVNSIGTRICLDRALADGARTLFASTSEVYGDPQVHPQPESYWGHVSSIGPRSVYDEAKRFGEALVMAYERSRGADIRLVRIFNTYGPWMQPQDGRVIPNFVSQALRRQPLTIFGDGTQTRSFCFVDDLVDGLVRLMESDVRGPCNLGNPNEMSMLELAEIVNRTLDNPAGIVHEPLPKHDPTRRRPDITRATTQLGWSPTVDFEAGFAQTAQWFRSVLLPA